MTQCGIPNDDLISYETPREGNPFETTVFAYEEGEVKCERLQGHRGLHGFTRNNVYHTFENEGIYRLESEVQN